MLRCSRASLQVNLVSGRCIVPTTSVASQTISVKVKQAPRLRWRRVVFKISGVALAGSSSGNFDPKVRLGYCFVCVVSH